MSASSTKISFVSIWSRSDCHAFTKASTCDANPDASPCSSAARIDARWRGTCPSLPVGGATALAGGAMPT
eukprot:6034385-Prymnesium_polylepis.2